MSEPIPIELLIEDYLADQLEGAQLEEFHELLRNDPMAVEALVRASVDSTLITGILRGRRPPSGNAGFVHL